MSNRPRLAPRRSTSVTVPGRRKGAAIVDDLDTQRIIHQLRALADDVVSDRSDPEPPLMSLEQTWGPFDIIREIGCGGFGTVYLAWESKLERVVALKLLRHVDGASAAIHEGRMLALAEHPNIVRALGVDEHEGRAGLWMEYIQGVTLKEYLLRNGTLGAHEACCIGVYLCQAIAAVHRAGLLHRDIKIHNVMREDGTGRIVLMDFGSGAVRSEDPSEMPALVGTPVYLAPELLTGSAPTVASDIYSLGVVLYHLVTLEFPTPGCTIELALSSQCNRQFVPLSDRRPDLPASFSAIVSRALARNPTRRYETVGAMQEDLVHAMGLAVRHVEAAPSCRCNGHPFLAPGVSRRNAVPRSRATRDMDRRGPGAVVQFPRK
jgi:serine/threonine protein kinase